METDLTVVAYIPEKSDIYHKPDFVCDNLASMSAGEFGVLIVTKGSTQITGGEYRSVMISSDTASMLAAAWTWSARGLHVPFTRKKFSPIR